jgi:hypothetical protein
VIALLWPGIALAAAVLTGIQTLRLEHAETRLAKEKTARAEEHAAAADALSVAVLKARTDERVKAALQKEKIDEALVDADRARASAAAAAGSAERLRQRAEALARSCAAGGGASAVAGGPAASSPGDVLADMQRRLEAAGRELARYADDARIAGRACEGSYDALKISD